MSKISSVANVANVVTELRRALYKISFADNFQTFTWTGDIAAGAEQWIPNGFAIQGFLPTGFLVSDGIGTLDISRSTTAWTMQTIYVKNNTASNATKLVIRFFR